MHIIPNMSSGEPPHTTITIFNNKENIFKSTSHLISRQSNILFIFQITVTVVTLHTVHWRVNLLRDLQAVSRKQVRQECTGDRWGVRITSSADNNGANRSVSLAAGFGQKEATLPCNKHSRRGGENPFP